MTRKEKTAAEAAWYEAQKNVNRLKTLRCGAENKLAIAVARVDGFDRELSEAVDIANKLYWEMNAAITPEIDADKPIPYTIAKEIPDAN